MEVWNFISWLMRFSIDVFTYSGNGWWFAGFPRVKDGFAVAVAVYRVRQWRCDKIRLLQLLPSSLLWCTDTGQILDFWYQPVNSDLFYIKHLFNFIQDGTALGPCTRVGGINTALLLASAGLWDDMAQIYHFSYVNGSMLDLNFAHIVKLISRSHKLPELREHKFW